VLLQKGWSTRVVVGVVAKALDSCGEVRPTDIIYREHRRFGVRVSVVKVRYRRNIVIQIFMKKMTLSQNNNFSLKMVQYHRYQII
jgi:hypothetical protein